MVTGFVFHTMLVASAFMLVKGNLTIDAKGTVSIKAGGPLTIQGAIIKLN